MPRLPRLNLPGYFFHIIGRGIEKSRIFRKSRDYEDFLARLAANLALSGAQCFAWALMPNHFHLLILSGVRGISALMHPLLSGYATAFNIRHDRVGHLFQNRFKSILCQEDPYFLELIRYIVLNPVRAGIVKTIDALSGFPWTSHPAMVGLIQQDWLQKDGVLRRFGRTANGALESYLAHLLAGWNQQKQPHLEGKALALLGLTPAERAGSSGIVPYDARILGDVNFMEEIAEQAEILENSRSQVKSNCSEEQLQLVIASQFNLTARALFRKSRVPSIVEARSLYVFAKTEWFEASGQELSKSLAMTSSSISAARERGRLLAEQHHLKSMLGIQ